VSEVNLGLIVLVLIVSVLTVTRFLLMRKHRRKMNAYYERALREQETFLKTFNDAPFGDFSAFDFRLGQFSCVSIFPRLVENEWRYSIFLSSAEAEDIVTISHELSECTLGRVIEKLLNLERPLYLQRKENDKFWIHGKKQKYLIEHIMTTLGEVDSLTREKLRERLNKEDVKAWLNLEL